MVGLPLKILYIGLDNAGKSSIILTLQRDFSKIAILKPTKGAKQRIFDFLGLSVGEWDLGGQKLYRRTYFQQADKIFGGTEIIIYVLDIQDKTRYNEALDYIKDVVEQLKILEIEPAIYIFFHKYDPVDIIGSQAEINNLSLELRDKIRSNFDYEHFDFYRTSIFDFQSIIRAMSKILLTKIPRAKVIEKTIHEYSEKIELDGLELIDDNSLIMGSYYRNRNIEKLMNAVTPFFLEINDTFNRVQVEEAYEEEDAEDQMMVQRFGKYFMFKKFKLKHGGSDFYVLTCKKDADFKEEEFDIFINLMKEVLNL